MSYPAFPQPPATAIPLLLSSFDPGFFFDEGHAQNVATNIAGGAGPMFFHAAASPGAPNFSPVEILSSYDVELPLTRLEAVPLRWGLKRGMLVYIPGGHTIRIG